MARAVITSSISSEAVVRKVVKEADKAVEASKIPKLILTTRSRTSRLNRINSNSSSNRLLGRSSRRTSTDRVDKYSLTDQVFWRQEVFLLKYAYAFSVKLSPFKQCNYIKNIEY